LVRGVVGKGWVSQYREKKYFQPQRKKKLRRGREKGDQRKIEEQRGA